MAKSKYGYTLEGLQNMEINKMTNDQLYDALKVLTYGANKRLNRLSQAKMGTVSPAYRKIASQQGLMNEKGEVIGVPHYSINKAAIYERKEGWSNKQWASNVRARLTNAVAELENFMQLETGSVKKWNKIRKRVRNRIKSTEKKLEQDGAELFENDEYANTDDFNDKEWLNIWEAISILEARFPNLVYKGKKGSDIIHLTAFKMAQENPGASTDQIVEAASRILEQVESANMSYSEFVQRQNEWNWSVDLGGNEL